MALRIAVGLFLRIFGFGLWLGKPSAAGLAQFFFGSALGAREGMCFPVEVAHFFANNGAAGGRNCRRARAVCVRCWAAHFAVGLARFLAS